MVQENSTDPIDMGQEIKIEAMNVEPLLSPTKHMSKKTFTEASVQTDPVRIISPGEPGYTTTVPVKPPPSSVLKPIQQARPKPEWTDDDSEDLIVDVEGEESDASTRKKKKVKGKAKTVKKAKGKGTAEEDEETAKKRKPTTTNKKPVKTKSKLPPIDPTELLDLSTTYPDTYWTHLPTTTSMIDTINTTTPLTLVKQADMRDAGHITGMVLSPDGSMLATFCTMGLAKVWDLETYRIIQTLQDTSEPNIDEFYVGRFTPTMTRLVVGGKLKDPKKWSDEDEDNHILPCPLKVFDLVSGSVVERLEGHEEEILCCKSVEFRGERYYVTTSQDGYIIKWKVDQDWSRLQEYKRMEDGKTCMAFNVSFLPNTGNKYFVAACDGGICLFDFENAVKLQTFENLYTCYCDCTKVVECLEYPEPPRTWQAVLEDGEPMFSYLLSRGVEEVDTVDGGDVPINTEPNTVRLHKLVYPTRRGGVFSLEEVKRFQHEEYRSNSWLTKISSNGRYVLAPTYDGAVVVFSLASGQVTAVLRDHEGVEVRDCVWGWRWGQVFTCGDDGTVKVYVQDRDTMAES
ncbi:hypothetical protein SpCBS45565_g06540 [Spizellomyces sp. 'palustris']|nr:hypothetical protein SpCBS45565_g06540 [Spizellomyces sp. 'palustris']